MVYMTPAWMAMETARRVLTLLDNPNPVYDCEYCGSAVDGRRCDSCGAGVKRAVRRRRVLVGSSTKPTRLSHTAKVKAVVVMNDDIESFRDAIDPAVAVLVKRLSSARQIAVLPIEPDAPCCVERVTSVEDRFSLRLTTADFRNLLLEVGYA